MRVEIERTNKPKKKKSKRGLEALTIFLILTLIAVLLNWNALKTFILLDSFSIFRCILSIGVISFIGWCIYDKAKLNFASAFIIVVTAPLIITLFLSTVSFLFDGEMRKSSFSPQVTYSLQGDKVTVIEISDKSITVKYFNGDIRQMKYESLSINNKSKEIKID